MTNKTHLIADESLGGLMREYTETDRKASVGDYVILVHPAYNYTSTTIGERFEVTELENVEGESCRGGAKTIASLKDTELRFYDYEYTTLSPTDIIHADGERFRMVDRNAKIGEQVVALKYYGDEAISEGLVATVLDASYCDGSIRAVIPGTEDEIFFDTDFGDRYRVLEPVEAAPEAEAIPEVTTAEASEQVIEMLANLSRRIVALEAENTKTGTLINDIASDAFKRILRLQEEIDTLHRNNVRLGEELERYRAEAKAPATTEATHEVDAVDFSGFIESVADAVAAKVADRIAKGLSR